MSCLATGTSPARLRFSATCIAAASVLMMLPSCLGIVGDGEEDPSLMTPASSPGGPGPYTFHSRNIVVPQIGSGQVSLKTTVTYNLWAEGCDGTAAEDTLLLLLDPQGKVVALNDDGGSAYPGGCSHLTYRPASSGTYRWEVWRKPAPVNPTRATTEGTVDVMLSDSSGGGVGLIQALALDVPVAGTPVGGMAIHGGTTITAVRPSRADLGVLRPTLLLLADAPGRVLDHHTSHAAQVRAPKGAPPSTRSVVLVGTRGQVSGIVDLKVGPRRLHATIPLSLSLPNQGKEIFGPQRLTGVGSLVVELSYATRVAVGDRVGYQSVTRSGGGDSGFSRYSGSSASDIMLQANLDLCADAACTTSRTVDSTTRYRGHFGASGTTSPIFLSSHAGEGTYRVRVGAIHADVYRTGAPRVWNDATGSQVTTLGNWNVYMDTKNLLCGAGHAPAAQVWTRYRNDVDLMALQEVEYQCHFDLLKRKSEQQDTKLWEFFYTRGDTYTTNCDDDYVGLLVGQRMWPNLRASSWNLAGRGRGLEHGRSSVDWYDAGPGRTRSIKCWRDGGWSMLCNSSKGERALDFMGGNRSNDPIYPSHAMGCRMRPDTDAANEYPHAMTARIRPTDGPTDGSRDIIVVVTHQIDFGSGDDPDDGGGYSHIKTYLEDLPALVYGTYGSRINRIIYMGDLNMWEEAHEWETMLRMLRQKFGYAIDTRLVQDGRPLSTWAGYGKACSDTSTGGQNDGVILLGDGWKEIDPAVSVRTEDWSASDGRGGRIEYRAPKEECKYWGLSCKKPAPDCVPACSGTPEQGCVNHGSAVLATDHKFLVTKVRTAF